MKCQRLFWGKYEKNIIFLSAEFAQRVLKINFVLPVIFQEINFTILDANGHGKNGSGLLYAVENLLCSVFIPALKSLDKGWGALDDKAAHQTRMDFLNTLDSFVTVLVGKNESYMLSLHIVDDILKYFPENW